MTRLYLFFAVVFCHILHAQEHVDNLHPGDSIIHVKEKYNIGDINNDMIADIAIAIYERILTTDNILENNCGQGICTVKIEFGNTIESITFEGMATYVTASIDVNNDNATEILVYKWWYECCWVTLDMYTYKNGKWRVIATSKAFITWNDNDFTNRVIKDKGNYYLIGDKWNKDYSGIIKDKHKIDLK